MSNFYFLETVKSVLDSSINHYYRYAIQSQEALITTITLFYLFVLNLFLSVEKSLYSHFHMVMKQ